MIDLNLVWFFIIGVVIAFYILLDGYDLGIGILSLFDRADRRHLYMRSIDYTWDANQVWFILAAGAFFAAFPAVYATVFSGLYVPLFLLLAALIFRAVSFEFRHNAETDRWRGIWEICFGLGSLAAALLLGISFGNVLYGMPLDANGNYMGTITELFRPYALLIGLLTVALFVMHGAAYLAMKTQGAMNQGAMTWTKRGGWASLVLYVAASVATFSVSPFLFDGLKSSPFLYLLMALLIAAFAAVFFLAEKKPSLLAFLGTSGVLVSILGLTGLGLYPRFIPVRPDPAASLTIYNSASTPRALTAMLIVVGISLPVVLAYTAYIHWVFRGKVDSADRGAEDGY